MKRHLSILAGIASVAAFAPAANAATFTPGSPNFTVSGNIANGPVSANIGNSGIVSGNFSDSFLFRIDQFGTGSGSISTSTSLIGSSTDLDILSVTVNGLAAARTTLGNGAGEFFSIGDVPILSGALNSIVVTGFSRGNGSYGGNATFTPAIPEPTTWAIMMIGIAGIGFGLRRQRRTTTSVSFG